jgi:hypothetical protein
MAISKDVEIIQGLERKIYTIRMLEESRGFLTLAQQTRLEELINTRKGYGRICDECDDNGEIINKKKITSRTIDMPFEKCPRCGGSKLIN